MSRHDIIKVGFVDINLPNPEGYQRYDGRNPSVDSGEQSLLPEDNIILASLCTETDLAQLISSGTYPSGIRMQVQTLKSFEGTSISNSDFDSQITPEIQRDWACQSEFEKDQDLQSALQESEGILQRVGIEYNRPVPLGTFGVIPGSVCFSMFQKFVPTAGGDAMIVFNASAIVAVKNKLVYLYLYSTDMSQQSLSSCRQLIVNWRDSILAANKGSFFSKLGF